MIFMFFSILGCALNVSAWGCKLTSSFSLHLCPGFSEFTSSSVHHVCRFLKTYLCVGGKGEQNPKLRMMMKNAQDIHVPGCLLLYTDSQ